MNHLHQWNSFLPFSTTYVNTKSKTTRKPSRWRICRTNEALLVELFAVI